MTLLMFLISRFLPADPRFARAAWLARERLVRNRSITDSNSFGRHHLDPIGLGLGGRGHLARAVLEAWRRNKCQEEAAATPAAAAPAAPSAPAKGTRSPSRSGGAVH